MTTKSLNTKIEHVTPALAEEYLKSNRHNRTLRLKHVNRLKEEILADRWLVTHQGIAFDEYGALVDGQHRLHAIKNSGKTVQMMVTRGLPVGKNGTGDLYTMDVIDCGRIRSTGDQLNLMHGVSNANLTAASARMVGAGCLGAPGLSALSVGQAVSILDVYGKNISEIIDFCSRSAVSRSAPVIGALSFGYEVDRDLALEFALGVTTGENIERGNPIYAIRELMITRKGKNHGSQEDRYVLLLTVTNAFYNALKGTSITSAKPGAQGLDFLLGKQRAKVQKVCEVLGRKPAPKSKP